MRIRETNKKTDQIFAINIQYVTKDGESGRLKLCRFESRHAVIAQLQLSYDLSCSPGVPSICQDPRLADNSSLSAGTGPGLGVFWRIKVTAAATPEDDEHQKEKGLLGGQQYGIDDAILAGPVGYPGISQLCLDDRTLGEDVPSHVVQIGLVLLYSLDLDSRGLTCLGVSDCGHIASQHAQLHISAQGLDLLDSDFGDRGVTLLSAYLILFLAPGRNQFPACGLPTDCALPTHIVIPQIATILRCTEFKGCGDFFPALRSSLSRRKVCFMKLISSCNCHIDRNPAAGSIPWHLCRW